MIMETRLPVNGISTAVTKRDGCSPAIVCIHGNSLSRKLFAPLFNVPSLKKYAMLSYDLPGHGETGIPSNPEVVYSMSGYAGHLQELLSILDLDRVVLLGFSLGGHLAIEAAGQNIASLVSGICSIGSPPLNTVQDFGPAFLQMPDGASLFVEDISAEQQKIIVDHITGDKDLKPILSRAIQTADPQARRFLFESIAAGAVHSEVAFLKKTEIPVMLCYGADEQMINKEYIDRDELKTVFQGRRKDIKNAGHLPSFRSEDSFVEEFTRFMEGRIV